MKLFVVLLGVVAAFAGCTTSNSKSCLDGTCGDPARPYCDADGSISGTPGLCISVDCTPDAFQMCRDDVAVVCNATGTNYEQRQCENGCGATGCNPPGVCVANANSCGANGALFMCNAEGLELTKVQDCQYGCTTDHCNACAASTTFCSGDDLVMCSSGGDITNPTTCQFGCQGTACNVCKPNTTYCQSSNAVTCTAGGQPGASQNCGAAGCQGGVCNSCTPNTTTCQGDNLVVCNGGGTVQSVTSCALGCNTTASPRCNSLVPSFGVPAPSGTLPNLTVDANATLDITNCAALDVKLTIGATTTTLPSSQVAVVSQTAQGGPPICVVKYGAISILDTFTLTVTNSVSAGNVLSLEGTGDITIAGKISFINAAPGPSPGADVGTVSTNAAGRYTSAGAGGGGGAFAGGTGGACIVCSGSTRGGGPGGAAVTSVALFGGSKGGDVLQAGPGNTLGRGGTGGGGLHLVSLTKVTVAASGVIYLNGNGGTGPSFNAGILTAGGGGSGGKLVVEAPTVNVSAGSIVVANGAGGAAGGYNLIDIGGMSPVAQHANGQGGQLAATRATGGDITNTTFGDGGYEADGSVSPSINGSDSDSGAATYDGGGGGGSRGFIVIRGRTAASIMVAFGAVISPAPVTGTVVAQ